MKFRGHETFFIRKGWLYKGMKYVAQNPRIFTDKSQNPMDTLGMGCNMVKSLRYWMQATGLAEESLEKGLGRIQTLTDFGKLIQKRDPYMEEHQFPTFVERSPTKSSKIQSDIWKFATFQGSKTEAVFLRV